MHSFVYCLEPPCPSYCPIRCLVVIQCFLILLEFPRASCETVYWKIQYVLTQIEVRGIRRLHYAYIVLLKKVAISIYDCGGGTGSRHEAVDYVLSQIEVRTVRHTDIVLIQEVAMPINDRS